VSDARPRIQLLPSDLANQIAAGEVVERPASVVKELLENAVDAGARRIVVEVEVGGVQLCRVTDDGVGMVREDAVLSLTRHATSKIFTLDDLSAIHSLGFRGEALPSIASVSRFLLRTRDAADDEGTELSLDGGGEVRLSPCGGAVGTSVQVRELFYNVPARKKFLRAVGTESAHITEVVQAAAFSQPTITFALNRDGRLAKEWLRSQSREERVRDILRGEALVACRGERGPLAVEAYLSRPERARSGAGSLWMFVNGRPVRDRALARAVAQAYGSVLEPGRYPIGAVYLDLPAELVDVNVHPQKSEVRFADGRAVADALYRIIAGQLASAFGLAEPPTSWGRKPKLLDTEAQGGATSPWAWSSGAAATPAHSDEGTSELSPLPPRVDAIEPAPLEMSETQPVDLLGASASSSHYGSLRFVAQVRRMFLVCEGADGLYVLDQHAAAERVTFHRLRASYAAQGAASQKLLFPLAVEVSPAEVGLVEEAQEEIAKTGLDVRVAGPSTLAVHAVPQLLGRAPPERLVRDLLAELGRHTGRAFSGAIDLALATMACHGSIRAGDAVPPEEARSLLEALDEVDFSGHCPHGRPIIMRIGFGELEHRVGRR